MKVLAIDPGPTQSAWVFYEDEQVIVKNISPNADLLHLIGKVNNQSAYLAIETFTSMGMAVGREVFETIFWIGRFCQAWNGPFYRISRITIKNHLCGSSRAKDANIRQALIDRYGFPGSKENPNPVTYGIVRDLWAALATGTVFMDLYRTGTIASEI